MAREAYLVVFVRFLDCEPDVFRTSSKAGPDWPSKADPVLLKLEGVLSPLPSAFNKTGVLSLLRLLFLN